MIEITSYVVNKYDLPHVHVLADLVADSQTDVSGLYINSSGQVVGKGIVGLNDNHILDPFSTVFTCDGKLFTLQSTNIWKEASSGTTVTNTNTLPTPTPPTEDDDDDDDDEPTTPPTPTTNTYWQLRTSQPYKYVILGTDDSTGSDPYVYRLIRKYGLKYTCNVIADALSNQMSSDAPSGLFTDANDPEALFSTAPTVSQFISTIANRNDVEIALHGTSAKPLIDTSLITDAIWDELYDDYTQGGGQQTLANFKTAFLAATESHDVNRGASYVATSKAAIEAATGKTITSAGVWGGNSCTVDGISGITVTNILSTQYNWKSAGFNAYGRYLVGAFNPTYRTRGTTNTPADYIRNLQRDSGGFYSSQINENLALMHPGDCIEMFVHNVTPATADTNLKEGLALLQSLQTQNTIRVVTRSEYAALGEYVANPVISLSVSRASTIVRGGIDSDSAYTIVCTHLDGTTSTPESDVILNRSAVNVSTVGNYTVWASYRGIYAQCTVSVTQSGGATTTSPTLSTWASGTLQPNFYNGYRISSAGSLNSTAGTGYDASDIYPISSTDTVTANVPTNQVFTAYYFTGPTISRETFVSEQLLSVNDPDGFALVIPATATHVAFGWHSSTTYHDAQIAAFSLNKTVAST